MITRGMAVSIVSLLEVVDVNDDERQWTALALCNREFNLCASLKRPTIGEPGEHIRRGKKFKMTVGGGQFFFAFDLIGHIDRSSSQHRAPMDVLVGELNRLEATKCPIGIWDLFDQFLDLPRIHYEKIVLPMCIRIGLREQLMIGSADPGSLVNPEEVRKFLVIEYVSSGRVLDESHVRGVLDEALEDVPAGFELLGQQTLLAQSLFCAAFRPPPLIQQCPDWQRRDQTYPDEGLQSQ